MTSVARPDAGADQRLGGRPVEAAHPVDRGRQVRLARPALAGARHQHAGAERLREEEPVAGPGAALAQQLVGMGGADHREAVLGLGIADRVAAGERAARLAHLGRRAREDLGHDVARQVLGEGRDRQREQHPAAHREDVRQRVRGGDLAEGPRVVHERREEVERADDREVVAHPVDRRVVGRGRGRRAARRARRPRSRPPDRPAPRPAGPPPAWPRSRRNRSGRSGGTGWARARS